MVHVMQPIYQHHLKDTTLQNGFDWVTRIVYGSWGFIEDL